MASNLYIGDLHLGNENASVIDFLMLLEKVKGKRYDEIIFLGDFLDGMDKYTTQKYKQYPSTLTIQMELFKWLIEFVANNMRYKRLVFVVGNHEMDHRGSILDFEMYGKVYNIKFARHYVDRNNMLCLHQLARSARVGSQSGWTPSLVDKARNLIEEYHTRGIITAHVHKVLDVVLSGKGLFVLLPAFLTSGRSVAEDFMYRPVVLEMDGDSISVYSRGFHDLETIRRFNMRLVSEIMVGRERVMDFDSVYKLYKSIRYELEDTRKRISVYVSGKGVRYELYYDPETSKYLVYKNDKHWYSLSESLFNQILRGFMELKSNSAIERETGVPRTVVGAIYYLVKNKF